jgi:hypothetical protein
LKVNVISISSSTTRILLYAAGAVKSNSEVTCLGLFPVLPVVVVSCNFCVGGGGAAETVLKFLGFDRTVYENPRNNRKR